MITKELLKEEIDKVPDEHLGVLYRIVRALEEDLEASVQPRMSEEEWKAWIAETYGSTADHPIELSPRSSKPPLQLKAFKWPTWPVGATFRREDIYGDDGR